jgi:hypothetical protein
MALHQSGTGLRELCLLATTFALRVFVNPYFPRSSTAWQEAALHLSEVHMLVAENLPGTNHFRVEVSGWDEDEIFFVEMSHLDWDDFAGKHISLRHMLPEGAFVFVRVLRPIAPQENPPIPYQVEFIGCDPDGLHQFRLDASVLATTPLSL